MRGVIKLTEERKCIFLLQTLQNDCLLILLCNRRALLFKQREITASHRSGIARRTKTGIICHTSSIIVCERFFNRYYVPRNPR